MQVRIDAIGNIVGHYPGVSAETLVIGSHLDTVPNAGKYDGVLGVMLAIAAVESLAGKKLPFAIDVIGFSEEEGVRFAMPYLGSRAVAGTFDESFLQLKDADGTSLNDAIAQFGVDPREIPSASFRNRKIIGFIEAHIEQGPVLEGLNLPVGVVEAIAGQSKLTLIFTGRAGHAGTVPMNRRRDALAAAAEFIVEVEEIGKNIPGLVATVGQIFCLPGATNVIPANVKCSLDVRHAEDSTRSAVLAKIVDAGKSLAQRRQIDFRIDGRSDQPAVPMDRQISAFLAGAVKEQGISVHRLPSGAGHDAAIMAALCPVAMLFLRNPGGISHHPDESVLAGDVEIALAVLSSLIERLAQEHRS